MTVLFPSFLPGQVSWESVCVGCLHSLQPLPAHRAFDPLSLGKPPSVAPFRSCCALFPWVLFSYFRFLNFSSLFFPQKIFTYVAFLLSWLQGVFPVSPIPLPLSWLFVQSLHPFIPEPWLHFSGPWFTTAYLQTLLPAVGGPRVLSFSISPFIRVPLSLSLSPGTCRLLGSLPSISARPTPPALLDQLLFAVVLLTLQQQAQLSSFWSAL